MSINTICSDKPVPTSASSAHFTNLTSSNADDIFGSTILAQPAPIAASTTTSRPTTSATTKAATFDDLDDDFEGLEDAKEGSADDDFANISRSGLDDFNPVFDSSPPPSQHKNDSAQGPVFGTEASFDFGSLSGTSAAGSTAGPIVPPTSSGTGAAKPTSQQGAEAHDWDALFAGLDPAATPTATGSSLTLATSAGNATTGNGDTNVVSANANVHANGEGEGGGEAGSRPAAPGRALTEGGEHDDPILKNLTGMGYSREAALAALEKYDYNLERVSSSLGGAKSAVAAAGARGVRKKGMWVG
jgi:epidermal growth factor receptor substrate 15